ncbi:hypothetical protein RM52_03215 [Microbacterium hominis]|uniref:Lipoprotein n=1 Tax=Microbacterium hominis TaxID=162426 RepID=A0A0B4CYK3_9MICO|nr:hypothetical protein RM52_03215 [Microbacterium hominis]
MRFVGVTALLAVVVTLAGCSDVNRVAARINADGSLDFATCDARNADFFEVTWSDDESAEQSAMSVTRIIGDIQTGDVFHLDAVAPASGWTSVTVASLGGQGPGILASFRAADLESGSWAWNQTGVFIGTVDVEHCELDEANIR